MYNPSVKHAVIAVRAAATMAPTDAASFLFDQYLTATPEGQDNIVLALIGELTTIYARKQYSKPDSEKVSA